MPSMWIAAVSCEAAIRMGLQLMARPYYRVRFTGVVHAADGWDVFEIASRLFSHGWLASVVLAWEKELSPNMEVVNPNGGAIALGHPLGGTGAILTTKAVHELQRVDGEYAVVTMCCGGGLGTGTLIQRL